MSVWGGVFVDMNTPALEKVLRSVQGNNDGYGHHFKSFALNDFVETKKFTQLVEIFQTIIKAEAQDFAENKFSANMLEKLKQHFNK